jgi:hypothetical protein
LKRIKPRRNEEHEERKTGKSLKRLLFSSPLRALGALRGENLFLDFYRREVAEAERANNKRVSDFTEHTSLKSRR